ncbi:hypothetical protein QOZ80_3AG0236280 [Eleusine coracana subsp. coracana]|nr:hypothetical protein QOZ80_3AG0236280 [Eleusine coracana subsp. coracana]
MEASFVDQLHNHGHHSHYGNGHGFKVLRGGVWEYIKYEKSNDCARSRTRYCLPANPWIEHFRPRHCSGNVPSDGLEDSEGDYESGTKTNRKRISVSHGRKKEACNGGNQLRVETTEVSDQNFADDEVEVDVESSKGSKKKRFSSTETLNDQVNSRDQSA